MKQAAAAYAIAILVVGLIVTAVMARETPTEKKEKQEKKAAAPQTYPSGMTPPREIATRVQAIRGKRFSGAAPGVEILKEEELAKRLTEADTAAEKEAAKEPDVAGLKQATDFVLTQTAAVRPPDLRRVTRQYGGVGTLGAYLPAERKIVLSEELTRSDRRFAEQVIAHEMARALEAPRATPRSALPFRDDDNASVALDEGAATVVEARYATKHLGVKPPVEPTVADRRADELEGRKAPAVQTYTQFPAAVGGPVVAALVREGGWKAVDEAKLQEPLSTRDILHPDTSETADDVPVPRPQITKALGKGWKKMADGEVGELDVLAHLASGGAERRAVQGAEGWVTGAFEVWTKGKKAAKSCKPPCRKEAATVVVLRFAGPDDALEYGTAVRRVLEETGGAEREGGRAWTIDDGGAALVRAGRFTALAFAPDAPFAGKVAEAALRP